VKALILTKSVTASGGVETVVNLHCQWLSQLDIDYSILSLTHTGYDKFSAVHYDSIFCGEVFLRKPFKYDLSLNYTSCLFRLAPHNDLLILHSPFLTGLISVFIYQLYVRVFKTSRLKFFFFHHAVPSSSIFSKLVYYAISFLIFKLSPQVVLALTSDSHANQRFHRLLGEPRFVIWPIPNPQVLPSPHPSSHFLSQVDSFKSRHSCIGLCLGRLSFYKGIDVLLKSLPLVRDQQCGFIIAGEGPLVNLIKSFITCNSSISDRILFICRRVTEAEKAILFDSSNFLVFPSVNRGEAYGIIQAEALSAGIPVINFNLQTGVNVITEPFLNSITSPFVGSPYSLACCIDLMIYKLKKEYIPFLPPSLVSTSRTLFDQDSARRKFISSIRAL
jgi:glycosyltransferase involved in cell wall biosynthesis